jgi:hypothetical protein
MSFKIAIQAVPERLVYCQRMKSELIKFGVSPEDIRIHVDAKKIGPFYNFSQIIKANVNTKVPVLYMQDDIVFCSNFVLHVRAIIKHNLFTTTFFAPPRNSYDSIPEGINIVNEPNFMWLQCALFSPEAIKLLHGNLDGVTTKHDDAFVRDVFKKYNKVTSVTIPSLVQHDLSIKSAMGHPVKVGNNRRETRLFYEVGPNHFKTLCVQ